MTTCNKEGKIVDVDCLYEDGKFMLSAPGACYGDLFTVRFRAPADYKAGDVIVFRKEELPVRTPGMASATTDIFKAGAIVHADIDLVGRRAFVWMGGVGGALPNLSFEEQFAGFYDTDGNKVYIKTIEMGDLAGSSTGTIKEIVHGILNIKSFIKEEFRYSCDGLNYFGYFANYDAKKLIFTRFTSEKAILYSCGLNVKNARSTLYYTCTDR